MNISEISKDFLWTADGDFYFDPDGEGGMYVATAYNDEVLSSAIIKRLSSTQGDWATAPELGADLIDFVGMPNTRETAAYIVSRVENVLVQDLMINSSDINIEVIPTGPNEVTLILLVESINAEKPIVVGFSFDMRDNKMIPRIINV